MKITSEIFEAYLKCPTKCRLRANGEPFSGNEYAQWVKTQRNSYCTKEIAILLTPLQGTEVAHSPDIENIRLAKWRFATNFVVKGNLDSGTIVESEFHCVERLLPQGRGKASQFIPIRFSFFNKLSKNDHMLVAFDALTLSKSLGRRVNAGKIIHGDKGTTLTLNLLGSAGKVEEMVEKIAAMLSISAPPNYVLCSHCAECEYQILCQQMAIDNDDLSLLSSMTPKERQKFRDKGIFTVTQLSHTFRPRRRPKHQRDKPEKYHHSLKALAIRQNKTHIVGNPILKIDGTPIYLDVEGLPDQDFYYLIGVQIGTGMAAKQYSFWADTIEDERKIWLEFINILQTVVNPVIIHYGGYETEFINKLIKRYGTLLEISTNPIPENHRTINLLGLLHGQVYFPTYSNSLKQIGGFLGFSWSKESPIGANSIACRCTWERTRNPSLKSRLIEYNIEDCQAAELITKELIRLTSTDPNEEKSEKSSDSEAVHVKSLKRPQRRWGNFVSPFKELEEINVSAWWDYQRDRIYVKSHEFAKPNCRHNGRERTSWLNRFPVGEVVVATEKPYCPYCGKAFENVRKRARKLLDLRFGKSSVKRRIVEYRFKEYWCSGCQRRYGEPSEFWPESHFGRNLVAYILYETIDLHIPFVTVQKNFEPLF
jgi:predicted RecB family nuclease